MTYRLIGANQSPYSVKMRAYLRARRIPFVWEWANAENRAETKELRPPVIPILQFPDGQFENDTTPLIHTLEKAWNDRPVNIDGARGLADLFLEDFGDEWGTKLMAHMRWHNVADREVLSQWVGSELAAGADAEHRAKLSKAFMQRQYERRHIFGSSDENDAFLIDLWKRITTGLADRLDESPYIMGSRPGRADFAWFGQLFQCLQDVTARSCILENTPAIMHWCSRMDDLSGIEWTTISADLPDSVSFRALLNLVGAYHLPLLSAHAKATADGSPDAPLTVNAREFTQPTFRYHVKCLDALRHAWSEATPGDRALLSEFFGQQI